MEGTRFGFDEELISSPEQGVTVESQSFTEEVPFIGESQVPLTSTKQEEEGFKMFDVEDPSSDSYMKRLRLVRDAALARTGNAAEANLAMYNAYDQQVNRYHRAQQYDLAAGEGYTDQSIATWIETGDASKLAKAKPIELETQMVDNGDGTRMLINSQTGDVIREYGTKKSEDRNTDFIEIDNYKVLVDTQTGKEIQRWPLTKEGRGSGKGGGQTAETQIGLETSLMEVRDLMNELGKGDATGPLDAATAGFYSYTGVGIPGMDAGRTANIQQRLNKVTKDQLPHVKQFFGPQISNQDVTMMLGFDGIDNKRDEAHNITALKSIEKRMLATKLAYEKNGNKPFANTAEAQAALNSALVELDANSAKSTSADDPLGLR